MYVTESVKEVNFRLLKGAPLRAHVIVKLQRIFLEGEGDVSSERRLRKKKTEDNAQKHDNGKY